MSSPTTRPRARSRLRATARWSLSHTTTLPVLSCSPASPMLRIVRSSPSCCPLPRLPLLPLPSCVSSAPRRAQGSAVDCRDPRFPRCARQRGKHHSNRFVLPYTSGAVCNKSSVAAMLGVMDNVAPFQGENEFPTMFRSIPILGSRSVVPRRWRAQQRSMPRPNSKTTTATPSSMKSYLRRGRVRSADCSRRSDRARTGRGFRRADRGL